ncbi:MAG TPA: hypothetical protein VIK18_22540 [Pirellulales bacterium]
MPDNKASGGVGDDEFVYRRVPVSANRYDPSRRDLSPDAFDPHKKSDPDGLSVVRARSEGHPDFLTPEQTAAAGPSAKGYYIAVLRVGDLRQNGIDVVPDPIVEHGKECPAHALIPCINASNRGTQFALDIMVLLAHKHTVEVLGPFGKLADARNGGPGGAVTDS